MSPCQSSKAFETIRSSTRAEMMKMSRFERMFVNRTIVEVAAQA